MSDLPQTNDTASSLRDAIWTPCGSVCCVTGLAADYEALAAHHYLAGRPGTMTRILALRATQRSATARFRGRRAEERPIAVLVESMPALRGRMRDYALNNRYGPWPVAQRARLLKAELRCISRVVVHPRFRGLGLAVKLVREALRTATTPLTEAHAAMGRVHPFFEKAGMTAYTPPRLACDARLLAALEALGFDPADLTLIEPLDDESAEDERPQEPETAIDPRGLRQRIESLPQRQRRWLGHELQRWYRQVGGRGEASDELSTWLTAAQQRLLLQPVYYLHDNRPFSEKS